MQHTRWKKTEMGLTGISAINFDDSNKIRNYLTMLTRLLFLKYLTNSNGSKENLLFSEVIIILFVLFWWHLFCASLNIIRCLFTFLFTS